MLPPTELLLFLIWLEQLYFLLSLTHVESNKVHRIFFFTLFFINKCTDSFSVVLLRETHISLLSKHFFQFFVMTAHLKATFCRFFNGVFFSQPITISLKLQYSRIVFCFQKSKYLPWCYICPRSIINYKRRTSTYIKRTKRYRCKPYNYSLEWVNASFKARYSYFQ